ncbi:UNVERIFIED_ORG: glycosyltransferase [Roseateles sp. XES5]|nr:glycosyltransferase [Roseateles sp. XES5]
MQRQKLLNIYPNGRLSNYVARDEFDPSKRETIQMLVSVVISTYNRCKSLKNTLAALELQTYRDFEVIIVNGPSNDGTAEVVEDRWPSAKLLHITERNLSKSRNVGIAAASGEIIAFIDDDGVASPTWLEEIVGAYDDPLVGGVGGLVVDANGVKLQYRYSLCDRLCVGEFIFGELAPDRLAAALKPGADPFLYLQGTNCSFRRDALAKIGGFNEQIEYYGDESDVCMRLIDSGYRLVPLDAASVMHKYAASHSRNAAGFVFDPYTTIKNHHLFALTNGKATRRPEQIYRNLEYYIQLCRDGARWHFARSNITREQLDFFNARLEAGVRAGILAARSPRLSCDFPPVIAAEFQPFATRKALQDDRPNVVLLSPRHHDKLLSDRILVYAEKLSQQGVVVHLVIRGQDQDMVDFDDRGYYVHRICFDEFAELERRYSSYLADKFDVMASRHLTRLNAPFDIRLVVVFEEPGFPNVLASIYDCPIVNANPAGTPVEFFDTDVVVRHSAVLERRGSTDGREASEQATVRSPREQIDIAVMDAVSSSQYSDDLHALNGFLDEAEPEAARLKAVRKIMLETDADFVRGAFEILYDRIPGATEFDHTPTQMLLRYGGRIEFLRHLVDSPEFELKQNYQEIRRQFASFAIRIKRVPDPTIQLGEKLAAEIYTKLGKHLKADDALEFMTACYQLILERNPDEHALSVGPKYLIGTAGGRLGYIRRMVWSEEFNGRPNSLFLRRALANFEAHESGFIDEVLQDELIQCQALLEKLMKSAVKDNDRAFVTLLYEAVLHRSPDDAAKASFHKFIDDAGGRERLIERLLSSREGKDFPRNHQILALLDRASKTTADASRLLLKRQTFFMKDALRKGTIRLSRGGGLGDVLMCTPVLREIKNRYPNLRLEFYTKFGALVQGLPFIDHVADVSEEPEDVIPMLYEKDVPTNRHLASIFAERCGFQIDDLTPLCWLDPKVLAKTSEKISHLPRPVVVIQRQASDWTPNKKWPIRYWEELLSCLTEIAFVIEVGVGAAGCEAHHNYLDMRGKTSLQEMAALIKLADAFVGPDSGPAHIAAAVETKAVVISGGYIHPNCISYKTTRLLSSEVPCLSCWLQTPCPNNLMCLGMITPDVVIDNVRDILATRPLVAGLEKHARA